MVSAKSLSLLALAGVAAAELPPIHIKGMKFFYENGTQFFMKGIAYQEDVAAGGKSNGDSKTDFKDPLSDGTACKRDVPLLKELGANTIRTYAIDPKADHSTCMKLLDDAGIYVISDLSQPALSINRDEPSWDVELFTRYKGVVDELANYQNVIGFFAGNEVSDAKNNTAASAYVKAAIRDTKKYIKDKHSDRTFGVGYATNDHPAIRKNIATYFNCGEDSDATDFWGYNIYSWCGESTMEKSGYNDQVEFFKNYNVPVFFAEYGCNTDGAANRIFQETEALFSDDMTGVFSGGLVYMYHQEANDYGVVKVENGKATKMKDFEALKKAHAKADPKGVDEDEYKPETGREECPATGDDWEANEILPPTPDESLCDCMEAASECGPADDLKEKSYGEIFGYICGEDKAVCKGIQGDAANGIFGAYSMCSQKAKLTYVLDTYYKKQKKDKTACDFDGQAKTKKANSESTCEKSLAAASSHNEEAATATGAVADATSTSDSDDKDGAGVMSTSMTRLSLFGNAAVGLYTVFAVGAGVAMIAL